MQKSGWQAEDQAFAQLNPDFYDLYSDFGLALGNKPTKPDPDLDQLSSGILSFGMG